MGYQPPLSHPVFFNGTAINTQNWQTGTDGVAITRIEGWYDAPDVRDVREQNPGRDGELADNLYLGGRTVTLEGLVSGSSFADLQAKKTALSAKLIPSASEYVLKMPLPSNASPSWTHNASMTDFERVSARVVEGVQFGDNDGPLLQSWAVTLRASDPLVYSDEVTVVDSGTSGTAARTAAVTNTGVYPSPGSIVVTGPTASAWEVYDSADNTYFSFSSLALATSSDTTTINLASRTIDTTATFNTARPLLKGYNSFWKFDETSGTTADNAQGTAARDGTYSGGFTLNQTGPLSGTKSVDLNGTTGFISVNHSAGLWGNQGDTHVWEFWFNLDALSGNRKLFDGYNSSNQSGFGINISAAGTVQVEYGTGAGVNVTSAGGVSASAWNHFVIAFNPYGSPKIVSWCNGVKQNWNNPQAISWPTATGLRFGSTRGGADFFDGKIGPCTQLLFAGANTAINEIDALLSASSTTTLRTFGKLDFTESKWSSIPTGANTYTLWSFGGLNTGSKLSMQYRNARV